MKLTKNAIFSPPSSSARTDQFHQCLHAFLLLLGIFHSINVLAEEIYVIPSVSVKTEYNDNKRLNLNSRNFAIDKSTYGVFSSAGGVFGIRSDNYEVEFDTTVRIDRYESDLDLDSENAFIKLDSEYRVTERNTLSLYSEYNRDTTLSTELETTGLIQQNLINENFSVAPSWTHLLSQTSSLQTQYAHGEVHYEESPISNFSDFITDQMSLTFSHQMTPLLAGNVSFSTLIFDIPDARSDNPLISGSRETTEYTLSFGIDYRPWDTWKTSFSIGGRYSETDSDQRLISPTQTFFSSTTTDEFDYVLALKLEKQFYSGVANLTYSKSTIPTGNGGLRSLEKFAMGYRHLLTETLKLSLNGGINVTEASSSGGATSDAAERTLFYVRPKLDWNIQEDLELNAGYQYRFQEYQDDREGAESNSFFIQFTYTWDKIATQEF